MRAAALIALTVAACGRVDFDPLEGHDEDDDGIPDRLDPCPHVPDQAIDGDADGVGDACDPNPTDPREHYVVFATMQLGDQPFDDTSRLTQEPDAMRFRETSIGLQITRAVGNVRVDIGFDIDGLIGTGQHQVAAGIERGVDPYYFVELNDDGALKNVALSRYAAASGYTVVASMSHAGIHTGRGSLRYDAIRDPAPEMRVDGGWVGERYGASGATPEYAGGSIVRFALNGVDVAIRYVVVISSDPA